MRNEVPFNPLDLTNLGLSIIQALVERPIEALPPSETFTGAGIYAIYYSGNFGPYRAIAEENVPGSYKVPIYIGKAIPAGARRTGFGIASSTGTVLYDRLAEHPASIRLAENLNIEDFRCRYLVVEQLWIPVAEALLIQRYRPLWNIIVDGFGNHDPGSGRYNQKRSAWDTIHPGRIWATRLQPSKLTEDQIFERVVAYLTAPPVVQADISMAAIEEASEDAEPPA